MAVSRDLGGVCRALQPAQKHRARLAVLCRFDPFLCRALLAFGSETACKRALEQVQRQWQGAQKSLASACGGQPSAPKSPLAEKRNYPRFRANSPA